MIVTKTINETRAELNKVRKTNSVISLVPTMGYLHDGHLSLVDSAKKESDFCCASIFVNPTQFGRGEDFNTYPRDIERDLSKLEKGNCDLVFIPEIKEMYNEEQQVQVSVGEISDIYEGKIRPGHFNGVATIVIKLFNIFQPDFSIFGQKDAQQAFVIKKMVTDLNLPLKVMIAPTVRESDGLAMSSRNSYFDAEMRKKVNILFPTLKCIESQYYSGINETQILIDTGLEFFTKFQFGELDYIAIVEKNSFKESSFLDESLEYFVLIAVRFGKIRLIDNLILSKK